MNDTRKTTLTLTDSDLIMLRLGISEMQQNVTEALARIASLSAERQQSVADIKKQIEENGRKYSALFDLLGRPAVQPRRRTIVL